MKPARLFLLGALAVTLLNSACQTSEVDTATQQTEPAPELGTVPEPEPPKELTAKQPYYIAPPQKMRTPPPPFQGAAPSRSVSGKIDIFPISREGGNLLIRGPFGIPILELAENVDGYTQLRARVYNHSEEAQQAFISVEGPNEGVFRFRLPKVDLGANEFCDISLRIPTAIREDFILKVR